MVGQLGGLVNPVGVEVFALLKVDVEEVIGGGEFLNGELSKCTWHICLLFWLRVVACHLTWVDGGDVSSLSTVP